MQFTAAAAALWHAAQLLTTVNSVMTTMYMTHTGAMHIHNKQSDRTAVIGFGDPGFAATSFASTRQTKNIKVCIILHIPWATELIRAEVHDIHWCWG